MAQVKKWFGVFLMAVVVGAMALPVSAQEETSAPEETTEDITVEVLKGPSELNPDKILGPGGVSITTSKDILMSFGATVRMIPVQESNWDFGLSNEVGGYFYTEPLKQFAGASLDTAQAVDTLYKSSLAFDDVLNGAGTGNITTNAAVISTFDDMVGAATQAEQKSALPQLGAYAAGVVSIQDLSLTVGNQALAAYAAGGSAGLDMAAAQAEQAYQAAATAAAANPANAALVQQAQGAGAVAAGLRTAANTVANNPAAAVNTREIAQAATLRTMAEGANLVGNADALAAGVAQKVKNDPSVTSADLPGSIAYLTALKARADSFSPYYLARSFLATHSNESGSVNDGYIRNETKLYFNAMPKDKRWSFYAALEFDRPIDNDSVDNRGGRGSNASNYGLERLNASIRLFDGLRFHVGWDIWGLDVIEAASMVYGDDNPGFWIKGDYDDIDFSVAWLKVDENDFQINAGDHNSASDDDRDLVAGYLDYKITDMSKFRFFAAWDRIRSVPSFDLTAAIASRAGLADYAGIYGNNGITGADAAAPEVDAYTVGGYYLATFGIFEVMAEGVYKFGTADDTGLKGVDNGVGIIAYNDYDISSYAFSADIAVELKDMVGWHSLRPHVGFIYTSGDDDPTDDTLGGYTGITSGQRFSTAWGGENTIIGDTNFLLGSTLYGYIPEYHGNGTPVFIGGLQNAVGSGSGRGDNPGLTMISAGITLRPKIFLIYRTNANFFIWNEDFYAANMVAPISVTPAGMQKTRYTKVEAGYVGWEWDNELTLALNRHMFIKTQASFFFPGEAIEDLTAAFSGGTQTDEIASRVGMEFIWNF